MTAAELTEEALKIFDEYNAVYTDSNVDLKVFIQKFLDKHINDFLLLLPDSVLTAVAKVPEENMTDAGSTIYEGHCYVLPKDYLKAMVVKAEGWTRTLYSGDIIEANSVERQMQNSKFTCGKTARPAACIENLIVTETEDNQGVKKVYQTVKKCISMWKCVPESDTDYPVEIFIYCPEFDSVEGTFLDMKPEILTAYIYYALYFAYNTMKETDYAQLCLQEMGSILSTAGITPVRPINLSESEGKK